MAGSPGDARTPGADAEAFGPYRLVERLGRGGMGEVHRAYDTRRDRWVALKRLASEVAEDAGIRERFERECRVAARLASPHVVPIHDFGVIDGRLFLDMRLIEGRDLGRVLREDGPLDPARAVAIGEQLAAALDAAHADGLVHRDVKPGNALVTAERGGDFVHLVDFGIVRFVQGATDHRLTEVGTAVGTLAYMAPEQIEGGPVDQRTDVYALAAVFSEALTGAPPFTGDMPRMLHQHLNVEPAAPSTRRPGLPPALDEVVRRGMAKRPDDRHPTTGALADAARAALTGPAPVRAPGPVPQGGVPTLIGTPASTPASTPPAGPPAGGPDATTGPVTPAPGGPGRWRGRRPWVAAGALVVVAALVVAAVVVTRQDDRRQDDTPLVVATGVGPSLASTFPDTVRGGCTVGNTANYRTTGGTVPDEVRQCSRGTSVAYLRWPAPGDAISRVEAYRSSPSVDGRRDWSVAGVTQGPYYATVTANNCTIVAAYTGVAAMVQVYAGADRCADVQRTFATLGLPAGDTLRGVEAAFPSAQQPSCDTGQVRPGVSGRAPREVRTCAGAESAMVSYTRWATPDEVAREADARRATGGGGPSLWTGTDGRRQGPSVQDEPDGQCRTLLGWDRVVYAVEVVAPTCDVVDRTVAVLAPPTGVALPG